jgi:uncharacterized protein
MMPTQTSYKQGTFSWVDLVTKDAEAAKKFYGALLGWTFDNHPAGHSMCKLNGQHVAAIIPMGMETAYWNIYVAVDDIDETTRKAAANGGKVIQEPFDIMDAGRTAVVQDPSGAALALWQAKKHLGAGVKDEPGALCWNELYTTNADAAGRFYANTLGWETETMDMGPAGPYTLFQRAGEGKQGNVGGMRDMPPGMKGRPSHWLAYFMVTDVDAATQKASDLGAKVNLGPMDIPHIGRFSLVQDPQGARFALFERTSGRTASSPSSISATSKSRCS